MKIKSNSKGIGVLFFSKEGRGGIETFLNQMNGLSNFGFITNFVFYKKDNFKKYGNSDVFLGVNYPKEVNFSFRKVAYFFENAKKTVELIRIKKPDIVFAVDIYSFFVLSTLKTFKFFNVKYVALVNTHIYHILSELRPNFLYRKLLVSAFKFVAGSPDKYVFTSSKLRDNMIFNLSVPKKKTIIIPHSVDIEKVTKLKNEKLNINENILFSKENFNLITVGRLEDQKDFKTILKAFKIVSYKIPIAKLFIIGDGQEKKYFIDFAKRLKISDKVVFLGWKRNIYKYLSNSEIFLFSSFYEGFAMVIVEAMASGIPVIATNSPFGPSEILNKGKYGKVIPIGDYKKMSEEIANLYKNNRLRKNIALKGIEHVKKYDTKLMVKSFHKLFLNI